MSTASHTCIDSEAHTETQTHTQTQTHTNTYKRYRNRKSTYKQIDHMCKQKSIEAIEPIDPHTHSNIKHTAIQNVTHIHNCALKDYHTHVTHSQNLEEE